MEGGAGLAAIGLAIIYGITTLFLLLSLGFALSYWKRQKTWKLLIALVGISGLVCVYFMLDNKEINSYLKFLFVIAFALVALLVEAGMEHSSKLWLKYLLLGICFNFIFFIVFNTFIERQTEDGFVRDILPLLFFYVNPVSVFIIWRYAKRLAGLKSVAREMVTKCILLGFILALASAVLSVIGMWTRTYLHHDPNLSVDVTPLTISFMKKFLTIATYTGLLIFFIRRRMVTIGPAGRVE